MKVAVIPFTVTSSVFLTTMTDRAYAAATTPVAAPIDVFKMGWDFLKPEIELPESVQMIINAVDATAKWIYELPQNGGELTALLMGWLYELCASLILKTPLWIFNNQWFENTTYMFSAVALGAVTVLTVIESIKQMLTGLYGKRKMKPMEMHTIAKRWFVVAGVTTIAPWLFQKAFQILNFVSDVLIGMGADTMKVYSEVENLTTLDVVTLMIFDIILIGTIIPVLWQNGKRFFDLMVLGVTAPLALTAWIFDPYRHLFNQWWHSVKELSLVQVYYALFLLVLGLFLFGVPTPPDFLGMVAKMLVVIGGFARMCHPPRLVTKHIDVGNKQDIQTKRAIKKIFGNYIESKTLIGKPIGLAKKAFTKPKPTTK